MRDNVTKRSVAGFDDLIDIEGIFAAFRRRIGTFFAAALLVFSASVLVTFQMTPLYTAVATVAIELREKDVADIREVLSGLPAASTAIDTEVEIIKSRAMAEKVAERLNLFEQRPVEDAATKKPSPIEIVKTQIKDALSFLRPDQVVVEFTPEELEQRRIENVIGAVQSGLRVARVRSTTVIQIAYVSPDPKTSAQIANAFADEYLVSQLNAKFEATSRANDWLNERLTSLREEVQADENAVELYRAQSGLLSAEGSSLTEKQISDLTAQLVIQRADYDEARARLNSVQSQLSNGASADTIGEVLSSGVIQNLRQRQATVTQRKAELSSRYGPRHPEILKVEREQADIQVQIDQEVARIVSSLRSEVEVARQKVSSLETALGQMKVELTQNNRSLVRLRELERSADASRTLYESFLTRFKETGEQESLNEADGQIISRAVVPGGKSSPNTMRNLMFGFILGGIVGAGLVFLFEVLDSGIKTGAEVEEDLGVPFIASVPVLQSGVMGTLNKLTGGALSAQDYLVKKPLSSFAESYRTLRSSIILSDVDKEQKVVAITSALPGEGKTTSSYCLGRLSAMSGSKTIVVDCDLRRRLLSKSLNDSKNTNQGLLQYLSGQAELSDVIVKDDKTDCDILPLAHASYLPSDIFGSAAFKKLISTLRSTYDLVIIDTAPILAVADTRTLVNMSDTVVVVSKWRKTKKHAVASAIEIIEDVGGHLSGVLLNQVDPNARSRYVGGDYSYYYSSYRKYYAD